MGTFLSPSLDAAVRSSSEVELTRGGTVPDTPGRGDAARDLVVAPASVTVTLRFEDSGKPSTSTGGDGTGGGTTEPTQEQGKHRLDEHSDVTAFGTIPSRYILMSERVGPYILRWETHSFDDLVAKYLEDNGVAGPGEGTPLTREQIVTAVAKVQDAAAGMIDYPEDHTYVFPLPYTLGDNDLIEASAAMGSGPGQASIEVTRNAIRVTCSQTSNDSRGATFTVRFWRAFG